MNEKGREERGGSRVCVGVGVSACVDVGMGVGEHKSACLPTSFAEMNDVKEVVFGRQFLAIKQSWRTSSYIWKKKDISSNALL